MVCSTLTPSRARRLARLAAGCAAGAACTACTADPTSPVGSADLPPNAPALGALEVTAEAPARAVQPGGSVAVTVRVVNRGDRPITVAGSGSCGVRLEVRDASGRLVEPSLSAACTADCRAYRFAPGEAFVREARFAPRVWSNAEQRTVTLRRGEYQLLGRVDGDLDTCGGTAVQTAGPAARVRVL